MSELEISRNLQDIASELESKFIEIAGGNFGFSLVVFNKIPGARLNYISNLDRADVIEVFKTLIQSWEDGMPDIPAHKIS